MSSRTGGRAASKTKGGFGISRRYKPTARPVVEGEQAVEPVEAALPEPELPERQLTSDEESSEEKDEEQGKRIRTRRVQTEEDEADDVRGNVVERLTTIAMAAFNKDEPSVLPSYVLELVEELSMDDADVLWEFASLSHLHHEPQNQVIEGIVQVDEARTALTDYYVAIRVALRERATDPLLAAGKGIPHYRSLVFESPLLAIERKIDDEHDAQLLRKDQPVRGAVSCGKCHDNLVSTRQVQLRGMDEPSTNIYTCYSCGNLWSV